MKLRNPDLTTVYLNGKTVEMGDKTGVLDGVLVDFKTEADGMHVLVSTESVPIRFVRARWNFTDTERRKDLPRILGDAWERGYGDLGWRGTEHTRSMPWYFFVSNGTDSLPDCKGRFTEAFGVAVRPNSLCFWQYDDCGVTLFLDLRCGGDGTKLRGRVLDAATVIFAEYRDIGAFDACASFCRLMSPVCLTARLPVYGFNNWYYAYGKSSDTDIISDSRFLARMTKGLENRPYMVIDDGWQINRTDAPWDRGNDRFGDMKKLADEMSACDVIPGIWIRYLSDFRREAAGIPDECHLSRNTGVLDPSHPGTIEYVKETTERIAGWGYRLIKHDYSTFDVFGSWGFQIRDQITGDGWSFYDTGRTSAEIILSFYRAILESSGGAVLIGCNCISHLCAGLVHLNRTGDDTSGYEWRRTRKMGVNTLAFRQMQNGSFYASDADCMGDTGAGIPWELNREWLRALSRSGSPLFVSCKPDTVTPEMEADIREAFAFASRQTDVLTPINWMETLTPSLFRLNGETVSFNWYGPHGADDFIPGIK